ncbi:type II secretion system protein N [Psychromonas antarctica]|uniref:type II secretion system protein N n=1 Tax=Psychromonas antarctica TaxID=67573 RepID=UPI001EE95302|nr:type II secretion system protein N [Psychromonas antarctica]MCG6200090.1 type II secretion system protein N [Psychromonas antarctica]
MKIKIILFFVLCYLLSLLITLPANKVTGFIPARSGIQIASVSGSIWQGRANQLTYKRKYHLQQVDWQIDWSALLNLHLKLNIEFTNGAHAMSGKGAVLFGISGVSVENLTVDSSAAELLAYLKLPLPVPVEATGNLLLEIKSATQGQPYCQLLDGDISWQDAEVNSDLGNIDLGTVDIDLSCEDGQLAASLQQQSGQLKSTIKMLLKEGGAYQLQGSLKDSDKLEPSIKQALSWLGRTTSSGETQLNYKGRL